MNFINKIERAIETAHFTKYNEEFVKAMVRMAYERGVVDGEAKARKASK